MRKMLSSLPSTSPFATRRGLGTALLGLLLALPTYGADDKKEEGATLPSLPEGVASFGAAVAGDDLVVYGGHVGRTHQHSIENLSHRFLRLNLKNSDAGWQSLDAQVEGLQGLPVVAYGRQVCRVGGLRAKNHVGSEEDLHSIDEVRCLDLDQGQWQELPDLPVGRSSHDAVVFDHHLYVVGGWQLRGVDEPSVWHDDMVVLDLRNPDKGWRSVPQPFERRALAAAAAGGKVYAFGGLGKEGTHRETEIYNIADNSWSRGPDIPAKDGGLKGFGVTAFGVGEQVYLSGADGLVHALHSADDKWQTHLAKLGKQRFFHRLLPHEDRLVIVAGAGFQGHLADLEILPMTDLKPGSAVEEEKTDDEPLSSLADTATWPGFRGTGDGSAPDADLPLTWSDQENLAWRVKVPGYGQSAPVLWHDQIFVTSVEGEQKETLIVSALAMDSGEVRWRRRFDASQEIPNTEMYSRGAPTPVVDKDRLYVFFESGDFVTLTHHGETLWHRSLSRDYGELKGNHGVGSSPVLTKNDVVVQVNHSGPSYFLALDKATGETHWKVDRKSGSAWTTPVVTSGKYGEEIISSAAGTVEGIDARNGERLWFRNGIEKNHIPSVTVDRGLVIVASSAAGHNFAIDRLGKGELEDARVAWTAEGVTSGFGSPVVHGNCVLFVNKAGAVTCIDRQSGQASWKHRLSAGQWASPIVSDERVYFFTKDGRSTVLGESADRPEVLSESALTVDGTVYGVAAGHDAFLLRTGSTLIKLAKSAGDSSSGATTAP